MTRLFEVRSTELLNHLKQTKFFEDINAAGTNDSNNSPKNTPSKKFYSASSISLTNISTGTVRTSRLVGTKSADQIEDESAILNDLFDQYLQICVKHLLSNKQKDKLIKHPKCFDTLKLDGGCQLINVIIFEVSVRLCAQSLFLTNASVYLSLCTRILASLFEKKNIKAKKNKSQAFEELFIKVENNNSGITQNVDSQKFNNFSNYIALVNSKNRQQQQNVNSSLLVGLYTTLFKSINIQTSNFVNLNSKLEIEAILNQIYMHLCLVCSEHEQSFVFILKKFTQSSFFNR